MRTSVQVRLFIAALQVCHIPVRTSVQVRLFFTAVGKLPPPVLQFQAVTFGYSHAHVLYQNVRCPPYWQCISSYRRPACASALSGNAMWSSQTAHFARLGQVRAT